jgi:hypothetical protein
MKILRNKSLYIVFTRHAENKFEILKRHKFLVSKKQVIKTIEYSEN